MKNIKKIIVFLLIILVIGFVLIYLNRLNMEINYIYNTEKEGNIDVMPENINYFFLNYEGYLNQRTLYKAIDWQVNTNIQKYYKLIKKIDEKGIANYYKENSKEILIRLGLENEKQFSSFINELRKLKGDSLILERYSFYPENAKKEEDYIEGILIIKYKDNEKIAFNIKALNNTDEDKTPISLTGNVSSNYYDFEFKKIEETNNTIDSPGKAIETKQYKIF